MNVKPVVIKAIKVYERVIVVFLLLMMMMVIATAVFDMSVILVKSINFSATVENLVTTEELHEVFSAFLLVLIGIELMETMKVYLVDNVVHVEVVFLVAMISVARHVVDLDYERLQPLTTVGLAAVILSLTGGYYLLKKAMSLNNGKTEDVSRKAS